MDTKEIEVLEGIFEASRDLLAVWQTGDIIATLQCLDRSVEVLETLRDLVEVDHPMHQDIREKIEEISRVRMSLSLEM